VIIAITNPKFANFLKRLSFSEHIKSLDNSIKLQDLFSDTQTVFITSKDLLSIESSLIENAESIIDKKNWSNLNKKACLK